MPWRKRPAAQWWNVPLALQANDKEIAAYWASLYPRATIVARLEAATTEPVFCEMAVQIGPPIAPRYAPCPHAPVPGETRCAQLHLEWRDAPAPQPQPSLQSRALQALRQLDAYTVWAPLPDRPAAPPEPEPYPTPPPRKIKASGTYTWRYCKGVFGFFPEPRKRDPELYGVVPSHDLVVPEDPHEAELLAALLAAEPQEIEPIPGIFKRKRWKRLNGAVPHSRSAQRCRKVSHHL
jgi:hypothetical protein